MGSINTDDLESRGFNIKTPDQAPALVLPNGVHIHNEDPVKAEKLRKVCEKYPNIWINKSPIMQDEDDGVGVCERSGILVDHEGFSVYVCTFTSPNEVLRQLKLASHGPNGRVRTREAVHGSGGEAEIGFATSNVLVHRFSHISQYRQTCGWRNGIPPQGRLHMGRISATINGR